VKIAGVESFLMSYALPEPLKLPFFNGERTILKRDAMYIRVTADSGLRGYAPGPADERAHNVIRDEIAPFLEGEDPRVRLKATEHPVHLKADATTPNSRGVRLQPDLARRKIYAAVELALMDLVARDEWCALSEVYGSRVRDAIKLYGSAGMYMSPAGYAEEAAAIQSMGFPAYKMRPARGPEADIETVRQMREATGPDFGLMVDAHSWWRMGDRSYGFDAVAHVAAQIARYNPTWLEEPLPPDDHESYRRLRALGHVRVATGEHEQEEAGFADLASRGAADVIQMDVCCQGGFAMGTRVVQATQDAGLRFAFHSWGTTLEVLAAAHFGICWPASVVEWLEYPCYSNDGRVGMYPFPLADEILKEPLEIRNGHLIVPRGPGLGIDIDERVVEKYPFMPGPWSRFEIYSPPSTIAVTGDHSLKWL
jgi:L-alanine-DL-glutamate epimerase-like enolase superfamily enzyme